MKRYLLDTNHAGGLLRNNTELAKKLEPRKGVEFGIPMPAIGELYFMAYHSEQVEKNLARVESIFKAHSIYPFDRDAAEDFGRIRAELRRIGRPIPQIDNQIAAVARVHRLTLLTADAHFKIVPDLDCENWLA